MRSFPAGALTRPGPRPCSADAWHPLRDCSCPAGPGDAVTQHTDTRRSFTEEGIHAHPASQTPRQLPAPAAGWGGRPPSTHTGVPPPCLFLRPTVSVGCWTKCSLSLCSEHLLNEQQMKRLLGLRECHPFKKNTSHRSACAGRRYRSWGSPEDTRPVAHDPPPPRAPSVPLLQSGFGNACKP